MYENPVLDNLDIKNIEIGADCGEFGRRFYAPCFLTDIQDLAALSRIEEGCSVDFSCEADKIPAPDSRFEKLICANPYKYGFKEIEEGMKLLEEWGRVLVDRGEIVLVGSSPKNDWLNPDVIQICSQKINPKWQIDIQTIDAATLYPSYTFFTTNKKRTTVPNLRITIKCLK